MEERPIYILPKSKKRAIIPKVITLIFLSIIFYFGIIINLALLELDSELKSLIQLSMSGFMAVIVIVGIILAVLRARKRYKFYRNKIMIGKKQILYQQIVKTEIKRSLWDKMFKTYSLSLNKKFVIKQIPSAINISDYIKKLITFSGGSF
jgi:fumarate reductase subunit D